MKISCSNIKKIVIFFQKNIFLIFSQKDSFSYISSKENFSSYISKNGSIHFSVQAQRIKKSTWRKFLILQEIEAPKKLPIFWKTKTLKNCFIFQESELWDLEKWKNSLLKHFLHFRKFEKKSEKILMYQEA